MSEAHVSASVSAEMKAVSHGTDMEALGDARYRHAGTGTQDGIAIHQAEQKQ